MQGRKKVTPESDKEGPRGKEMAMGRTGRRITFPTTHCFSLVLPQMGALVGAISSVSQASTSSGGVGKGGLLSGPMAGNVLQNALGGGGDKSSLVGLPAFTGTVDTTATGTGEVYKPAVGDGGNAIGSKTLGAAVKAASAPADCGAPMTIDIESFTEYRVFVDGNQVGGKRGQEGGGGEGGRGGGGWCWRSRGALPLSVAC